VATAKKNSSKASASASEKKVTPAKVTTKVRVIKDNKPEISTDKKSVVAEKVTKEDKKSTVKAPREKHGNYFVGAWYELRQVKWPTRRTTWGLTIAVLLFTLILMLFIVGLDALFDLLFKRIIG
jgi:preprotein translocase SecE subunit